MGFGNGSTDPQQLNRYSYALNNLLRYTDPTGHCEPGTCALTRAAAGGVVAGPTGAGVGGIAGAVVDLSAVVLGSAAVVSGVAPALASDESPVDSVSGAEGLPTSSEDNGPVIIPHDTERQARRAAERDAGMGRHGPREERVEDYKPGSRSPAGDPGRRRVTENSSDPPGRRRSVEHDRYGHRFPDGSTIPPHYGSRTPGQPTRHHTYPSPHNPQNNR